MSPELLQDDAWPTLESDMWAFGCVAFWIFSGLIPYHTSKHEFQVVPRVSAGSPPNDIAHLTDVQRSNALWLTNGVWALISRCWSPTVSQRPTATRCLQDLRNVPRMPETSFIPSRWVLVGIDDLTGSVKRAEGPGYERALSWSQGIWRGVYDWKGSRSLKITLWCRRSTLSQGFFRRNIEVALKGVQEYAADRFMYAARQSIKHELLLLQQLRHSNICSLLGLDQHNLKFPVIVSEFCSNGTLDEYYLRKSHELDDKDRLGLIRGVTDAVYYLHNEVTQGPVVHGNLSMVRNLLIP
ncbi:hypothetical protein BDV93DRAFT_128280 [Ceratobasidium sp. AG-I]|nr:hypothetical protein BDV93DRAFT_128280 [Ceratobasidium sp. AG-I]